MILTGSKMKVQVSVQLTYKSNSPLNVGVLNIAALDGLVSPVQLPGDAKISGDDDQIGQESTEHRQSRDEGGIIQGLPVAHPVH